MKKIIFLLLISVVSYGQADFPEGVQISGGQPTVTSVNFLTATGLDGLQQKITPANLGASLTNVIHTTGNETKTGNFTVIGNFTVKENISVDGVTSSNIDLYSNSVKRGNLYTDSGIIIFGSNTNIPVTLKTNSIERLRFNSDGKIFINSMADNGSSDIVQINGNVGANQIRNLSTVFVGDQINEYSTNSDSGGIALNFNGYNGGTTRFRNLSVYNGKNSLIFTASGATGNVNFTGGISAVSYSGGAALTGAPTAPTATAGTNTTQIATTAFVLANSRPYKVYTALLTQTGTSAPTVVNTQENTLGGTLVWTRNAVGEYYATLSGLFTGGFSKIYFSLTNNDYVSATDISYKLNVVNSNTVSLRTYLGTTLTDSMIGTASIEIRVYP